MLRRIFLGASALSLTLALGCSSGTDTAQTPTPTVTTPAPAPAPSINTTPAMPTTEGAATSADPAATTTPIPGAEGMPNDAATAAVDTTVQPGNPEPDYAAGGTDAAPVTQPDYSVPGSEGGMPTEGAPDKSPLGMLGNLISGFTGKKPDAAAPMPGMEGMPYGPNGAPTAPPEKPFEKMTLKERAESSFAKGKETDGFRWLYAHAIADEMSKSDNTLDEFRWLPGPKHPSLAARFGVAVKFEASGFAGVPPVIGDDVPGLLEKRKGEGQGGTENLASTSTTSDRPKEVPTTAPKTLRFFAGDMGTTFLDKFQATRDEKGWGEPLAEMGSAGALLPANPNGMAGNPYGVDYSTTTTSTPAAESGSDGEKRNVKPALSLTGGDQISPGIVWLGFEDTATSAAKKAGPLGIDCVLLVDVRIQTGRNAPPRNKTKVTAMDVASQKPVASTPLLDHFDVYELRELRPNAPDPVKGAIGDLFAELSKNYAMQPMPQISADAALNRGRQLIAAPPADPLPALAEMRYYLKEKLIDDAQYAVACKKLAGDEALGEALVSKKAKDRKEAVEKLIAAMAPDAVTGAKDAEEPKSEPERPTATTAETSVGP